MAYFVLMIGAAIIGISYLVRGEVKMTKNRIVDASTGRGLGLVLLAGVALDFIGLSTQGGFFYASLIAMIIAIAVGLAKARKIEE